MFHVPLTDTDVEPVEPDGHELDTPASPHPHPQAEPDGHPDPVPWVLPPQDQQLTPVCVTDVKMAPTSLQQCSKTAHSSAE